MRLPRKEGLNIVPFVDIMLVLLAITLSTASFIVQGKIQVNIPESSTAQIVDEDKKVQISIDSNNRFFIEDSEVSMEELRARIGQIDRKTRIELRSDSDAKFSSFIEILDILKERGHENFAIQAKLKN